MGFSAGKNLQNNINVDEAQTLSNKTLDSTTVVEAGATIQNPEIIDPNRVDVKKDTLANLETYALTASNGQLVYATDSKQMFQVLDAELTQIGSGGSSGNLLSEIERLTPTVSNVVAVTDNVTFLPVDDNNKSVKATFSGSDGFIRYEAPASADLDGVQGAAIVWIKTSVENLEIYATKDGVAETGSLQIIANNKWRQYEIPIVLGDADYGFEIKASGAVSGDVFIDEAFVKVQRVVKELVGEKHIVEAEKSASQDLLASTFATVLFDNEIKDNGNIYDPSTGIVTIKKSGSYRVNAQVFIGTFSNTATVQTDIIINGNSTPSAQFQCLIHTTAFNWMCAVDRTFKLLAGDTVNIRAWQNTGATRTITTSYRTYFNLEQISEDTSTVVTQDTELTAKTDNLFTAQVSSTGAGRLNYDDWITCTPSSTPYVCTFKTGLFTENPNCTATAIDGAGTNRVVHITTLDTNNLTVDTFNSTTGGSSSVPAQVQCRKTGADYNKSATIVGKFENINSSDLVKVLARGNDGTGITGNSTPINFTETEDNLNTWDGSRFTAPKDSYYFFNGKVRVTTSISALKIFINGSDDGFIGYEGNTSDMVQFTAIRRMSKNEYAEIVSDSTATLSNLPLAHSLEITELPDTESIIKNLSQQKTKCQTKYLSGDVTADGDISDLTFNNLVIGKKYRLYSKLRANYSAGGGNDNIVLRHINNGNVVCFPVWGADAANNASTFEVCDFVANDTTLTGNALSISSGNSINGDGTVQESFARLCELPDTYVETDEW